MMLTLSSCHHDHQDNDHQGDNQDIWAKQTTKQKRRGTWQETPTYNPKGYKFDQFENYLLITHFQLEKQVDKYDPNYYNPDNDQYLGNLLAVLSNRNIWIMLVKYLASSDHVMVMMKLITMTMITMIITMMTNITLRRDVEVDVEMIWICQGCLNVSAGKASLDHLPTGSSNIFHQLGLSFLALQGALMVMMCYCSLFIHNLTFF